MCLIIKSIRWLILAVLLINCSPKIIDIDNYKVVVSSNRQIIENNSIFNNRMITIDYSFVHSGKSDIKMTPVIYKIGRVEFIGTITLQNEPIAYTHIKPNTPYRAHLYLGTAGEGMVLFMWKRGNRYFTKPFIINMRYYGY